MKTHRQEKKFNLEKIVCGRGKVKKMTMTILKETRKDIVPMNQEHDAISKGKFRGQ